MRTLEEVQEKLASYKQELHDELQNLTKLREDVINHPFDATPIYNNIEDSMERITQLHAKTDALKWVLM